MHEKAKFLSQIIPRGGRYVGFVSGKTRGTGRNVSANTAEELVALLLKENEQGRNVYFAPASYGAGKTRKKTDVIGLRALWFDVDAHGEHKGYDTVDAARLAALGGCAALGLPAPIVVDSGGGVQCWYLFSSLVEQGLWERLASALKRGLKSVGVAADPTRTADAASVMRLPGSINHKWGVEAQVNMEASSFARHDPAVLGAILQKFGAAVHLATSRDRPAKGKGSRYHKNNKAAELIVEGCAQIRHFKETGSDKESHWFGSASILAACLDGERLFHEWSSTYKGYSAEEAQAKFDAALEKDAPHSCDTFSQCNDLCEGCPHRGEVKGPAELGVLRSKPPEDIVTASGEEINFAKWAEDFPQGFSLNNDLQLVQVEGSEAGNIETLVCDMPIRLTGIAKDEDSNKKYVALQQYNVGQAELEHNIVAIKDLTGIAGIGEIRNFGAAVYRPDLMGYYITACIARLNRLPRMADLYKSFGWKSEGFLLGHTLFTEEGPKPAALQPESFADAKASELQPGGGRRKGSLQGWKEAVLPFLQPGFEFQLDALVASFASPLMGLLAPTEGGVMRSYCSPKTGGGKTTASQLAQSAWGLERALQITATTSEITRQNIWSGAGGLPTFEDESLRQDAEMMKDRVTRFTMGLNTQRSSKSGKVNPDRDRRSSIHIVTANTSMIAALSQFQGSDAMQARVFETQVPVLPTKGSAKLLTGLIDNPGYAGPEFMAYVMTNKRAVKKLLQTAQAFFADTFPTPAYRYKVNYLACCSVAARVLNKLELVRFGIDTYVNWLVEEVKSEPGYTKEKKEEDILRGFFDYARDKTLTVCHGTLGGRLSVSVVPGTLEPREKIAVRMEMGKERCIISRKELTSYLAEQSRSPKEFLAWMEDAGHLAQMSQRDLTQGLPNHTKGQEHVVIMSLKKWKLDDIQD